MWIEIKVTKATERAPEPGSLLPLTPAVFHILLALAGGECHGYGIMQEVERLTKGQLRLGPGTLYRSIQRMLIEGLIEETADGPDSFSDDERRRNYRLTEFGRVVARAESLRLEVLVEAARQRKLLGRLEDLSPRQLQKRAGEFNAEHARSPNDADE